MHVGISGTQRLIIPESRITGSGDMFHMGASSLIHILWKENESSLFFNIVQTRKFFISVSYLIL